MRQPIWKRFRVLFFPANGNLESPETFREDLNNQCDKILFFSSLIAVFAWLPHPLIDYQLHPDQPLIIALRFGLSIIGLTVLVLQRLKHFHRHKLLLLIIIAAYIEIAMGIITGLTKADPAYLAGYLLVISFLALGPYPRRVAWLILATSLVFFFTVGFASGMHFNSVRARYGLIDLFVAVLIASILIYLLDRLRFGSWEKSRKIEQQNSILISDKSRIDKLLQDIRLSEAKYRQLFDHSPIGIFLTAPDGKVLEANRAMLTLLGFDSIDDLNVAGLQNLYVNPEDRAVLWGKAHTGPVYGFETIFHKAGGELVCVSIGGYLVSDQEGDATLLEGTIEDVTERKTMEEALRESEEKFRLIVNTIPHIVSIWDMTLHCTYMNPSIQRLLGYTPSEAMSLRMDQLLTPESMIIAMQAYQEDLEREKTPGFSGHHVRILQLDECHKNGSVIPFENFITFLRDAKGVPIGIIILGIDISERKRSEELIKKVNEELAVANKGLSATNIELEAANDKLLSMNRELSITASALRESEERLRAIIEGTQASLATVDAGGFFTYVNDAMAKALGLNKTEDLIGKRYLHFVHPDDRQRVRESFLRQVDTRQPSSMQEFRVIDAEGNVKWLSFLSTLLIRDGKVAGQTGVAQNVTERKLAEEALRRNEEKYRLIAENSGDVIFTMDRGFRITYISPAVLKLRGMDTIEAMQQTLDETMTAASLARLQEEYNRVLPEIEKGCNPSAQIEIEQYRKDGSTIWVEMSLRTMRDDAGNLTGYVGVSRDISERKRIEQELRNSERRMADIIDFLPIATMVIDREGRVTAWNRTMEAITKVTRTEILGKGDYEYAIPFYGEKRPILIDLVYASKDELAARYSHIRREGNILTAESFIPKLGENGIILIGFASPLYDMNGSIIGAIESILDVTEIRRVEAELKEAKEAADAANRSKSAFLANMSHEIRTPMNAILGFAQLMERDPTLSPQSHEHLEIINRSGEHLLALINDILEMSKIEAGRAIFAPKTFDLQVLLQDIERMFRIRTETKGLRFLMEMVGQVPRWIVTDEGKLRQVLINLLGNAVKFTREGGIALRIATGRVGDDTLVVRFEVQDTGPGILEEEIDRLFQPFEQTRAGVKNGGTGLGLALSRGFVKILGGQSIEVKSTVGKGTTFRFEIPVREGQENQAKLKETRKRVLGVRPGQGEIRVLIADDRETNRQLLSQLLGPLGFSIRHSVNGEEALKEVRTWNPQVVLMDMTMPVMDGYEAIRIIKSDPKLKDTPILALTASAFEEDKQRILAVGANGYLSKPFKDEDLFENIRRLTGVSYLYQEGVMEKPTRKAEDRAAMCRIVVSLPSDLVSQIREAVESADLDLFNELAEKLAADQPVFAEQIREMARRYEYDALIELFSGG